MERKVIMAKFKLPDDDDELFEIINQGNTEGKYEQKDMAKSAPSEQVNAKSQNNSVAPQPATPNPVIGDTEVDSERQRRKEYNSKRNYITSIVTPLERKYIEVMRQKQKVSYSEYIQSLIERDMEEHPVEVNFAKMMLEQFESFLS